MLPGAQIEQPVQKSVPPAAVAPRARRPLWILAIPIAILAMGLILWAVLAGMPFGTPDTNIKGSRSAATDTASSPDTIAESTVGTTTVSQIGEPATSVPQQPQPKPAPAPRPPAVNTNPPMASAVSTISEAEAESRLRDYLLSASNVDGPCLDIRSLGYRNAGYTLDAVDTCATDSGAALGRWRVDAITREVFRQNENGKYVRP